jgi:hypothetical protein
MASEGGGVMVFYTGLRGWFAFWWESTAAWL